MYEVEKLIEDFQQDFLPGDFVSDLEDHCKDLDKTDQSSLASHMSLSSISGSLDVTTPNLFDTPCEMYLEMEREKNEQLGELAKQLKELKRLHSEELEMERATNEQLAKQLKGLEGTICSVLVVLMVRIPLKKEEELILLCLWVWLFVAVLRYC